MIFKTYKMTPVFSVTEFVNISYYKLPKNYEFPGESHDFWELIYVDQGELVVTAGSNKFLLKAGELAFHCPHEFHSFQVASQNYVNIIIISFYCDSTYMKAFENKILFLHYAEKQCLSAIAKEAEGAFEHFDHAPPLIDMRKKASAPFGSDQLICTSLEQLFIHIYRRDDNIHIQDRSMPFKRLQHHEEFALQIKDYLKKHFNERITLASLADKHCISVSQLRFIYKEQMGSSIIADLTGIRISEAKRMIRENNLNFTQIAEAVGYDNIYYFSNQFKKHTGMTPTEYSRSVRS